MEGSTTRRAALCGGALVIAIGAGAVVAPAAEASPQGGLLPGVTSGILPGVTSGVLPGVTSGLLTGATSGLGSVVTAPLSTVGALAGQPSIVPMVSTTTLPVVPVTLPVLGGNGSGLVGVSTGSGSGGGVGVTVGGNGSGGSVVSVQLGGSGSDPLVAVGTPGAPGVTGTAGVDGATGTTPSGTPAASGDLLGLGVRRSLTTVYPVKDGYRDTVSFTFDGVTSSARPEAVEGVAVLRRGATVVKRWTLSRSDQVLTWNGTAGSKIVPGTYRLTAGARDAANHAFAATSTVKVSAKRLVATTSKYSKLAVSGTQQMASAPRAGLQKGRVTVRITTVASKVKGTQRLIFERGGKRIAVAVKRGTHTSRAITVPASFTRFTIKHTWKKGQVKLKAIRYVYSYQSLR